MSKKTDLYQKSDGLGKAAQKGKRVGSIPGKTCQNGGLSATKLFHFQRPFAITSSLLAIVPVAIGDFLERTGHKEQRVIDKDEGARDPC